MIYSTENFIKYGNKGVENYGYDYRLEHAHKIIKKSGISSMAILNNREKKGIKLFNTGKDIGQR
jgi:hypothetical protein